MTTRLASTFCNAVGLGKNRAIGIPLMFNSFLSVRNLSSMYIAEKFAEHKVVPDVIPKAPPKEVKVVFSGGQEANFGNVLTPTVVKDPPKLTWESKPGAFYTIVKTDPDAPSRKDPKFREWHHWLVVNIKGNDVNNGDTLSEYVGAGPPPETGLHRYVFLVYEQPDGKPVSDPEHRHLTNTSSDKRGNFKIVDFAAKHNLGTPVAGNFYQAEYDDYVPILYKQLGA